MWSLVLLGAAALAISLAGVQRAASATAGFLALGVGLVGCFLVIDRRTRASVLPRAAFGPGPLKWMYLGIGVLMAATMVDMYVPLFGQRLAHMTPLAAGFLGAVIAVGWTLSEIVSASVSTNPRGRASGGRRTGGHGVGPGLGRADATRRARRGR